MMAGLAVAARGRIDGLTFHFGAGGFREGEIFDSANCPPSRYLVEIARRLLRASPEADMLVIGNPLLPLSREHLIGWTETARSCPAILTDRDNFPLAYLLPARLLAEQERLFLTLSMVDAGLDERLLTLIAERPVRSNAAASFAIGNFPVSTPTQWFQGAARQRMLQLLSMAALSTMQRNPAWRRLPFASYQPYHAGSLLFLNLAARQLGDTGLFDHQIVCWSYKDIVRACPSPLAPIWLRLPWLPRDNSVGELDYLARSLERLGSEVIDTHFISFMRYSRIYSATPFHLVDQLKFALGDSMLTPEATLAGQPPLASARADLPLTPLKLLFHLAGGWRLKNYPVAHARAVIASLKALGCEITVLDRADLTGVRAAQSDDTAALTALVRDHHLFIGVDSFPHHFVRHVLGWPTIGLFANTKPCNSDAKDARDYRALVGHLPCSPCGGHDKCPLLGGEDCANFVEPARLVSAILQMAQDLYGFTP